MNLPSSLPRMVLGVQQNQEILGIYQYHHSVSRMNCHSSTIYIHPRLPCHSQALRRAQLPRHLNLIPPFRRRRHHRRLQRQVYHHTIDINLAMARNHEIFSFVISEQLSIS